MSNLSIPANTWLKELFKYEYCNDCGGDTEHHDAIPFVGNWFAKCKFPIPEGSDDYHPVIQEFRVKDTLKLTTS